MSPPVPPAERPVALASAPLSGIGPADGTVFLPRFGSVAAALDARWRRLQRALTLQPLAARLSLSFILLACLTIAVWASAGPSDLVPQSHVVFPGWEAGPLSGIIGHLPTGHTGLTIGLSVVVLAMLIAWGALLASVRSLSMRLIAGFVVAVHAVLLLSPPMQLTDIFNYLGYSRLGGLHGLNPYTHVIAAEIHDPIYHFATWYHLPSPYGPLFTVLTYPISFLSLGAAYWTLKGLTVLLSLGFLALVWRCARMLGRDPRFAVLFVAANPVYLVYEVGGFHNDFYMLVPMIAAVALLLARRDRWAGAMVAVAFFIKFTAILLLPFLLLAVWSHRERLLRVIVGAAAAAGPLLAMHLAFFGISLPNLADQSTLLTPFSVPNVIGTILGLGGGTPTLLRLANVLLVICVALLLRRGREWLAGAGWATLALIASLAWLVPWYVVWLLPLAALARNLRLRQAAVALTVYLVLAFIPTTGLIMSKLGLNLMGGSAGQASRVLQQKLER